jgi:hypothetical protein
MTISDRLGNAIERNSVPAQQFSETYGPANEVPKADFGNEEMLLHKAP